MVCREWFVMANLLKCDILCSHSASAAMRQELGHELDYAIL